MGMIFHFLHGKSQHLCLCITHALLSSILSALPMVKTCALCYTILIDCDNTL